jgi:hypothetical protein
MADARLTQCNVVVQFSESVQKTANGKNRPKTAIRGLPQMFVAVLRLSGTLPPLPQKGNNCKDYTD